MPKIHEPVSEFHSIWSVVDDHWRCVSDSTIEDPLCIYLAKHGFDISDTITYCLAESEHYTLKFRVYGAYIHLFIKPKN